MSDIIIEVESTPRHQGQKKVQFSTIQTHYNFNTTKVALTPSINRLTPTYKVPEERSASCVAPQGTISRPNYEGDEVVNVEIVDNHFLSSFPHDAFCINIQIYFAE